MSLLASGALLTIDLDAICDNWRALKARVGRADCGAVVKADAYGLGATQVAPALAQAGCRHFFVAHLLEALNLRPCLPMSATIYVLHGLPPGAEGECDGGGIVPVLNSLSQVSAWRMLAAKRAQRLSAVVQVDTGMSRLGLSDAEMDQLVEDAGSLNGIDVRYVMSHLACAEVQSQAFNGVQRERFEALRRRLPAAPASLANSSGIFLGPDYHFDLVRPGAALYGVAPIAGAANPMRPVVRLQGRVVQLRDIAAGACVGYGQTWQALKPSRIATVALGYADGWLRSLGNQGAAWFEGVQLPLVGKVSMDTLCLDVSTLTDSALQPGMFVDLINAQHDIDEVGLHAGTIAYEILTSLGSRYERHYLGGGFDLPVHFKP